MCGADRPADRPELAPERRAGARSGEASLVTQGAARVALGAVGGPGAHSLPGTGKYPWPVFSPRGPSVRELAMQALSSAGGGYDLLAPKFDHTPFRTPYDVLDATAGTLRPLGPFGRGLDVCCGTGAGLRVLTSLCHLPTKRAVPQARAPASAVAMSRPRAALTVADGWPAWR
jgi:hypothetical protein